MASSSSSSYIRRYHVFPSFHGPDVRRGFLSHLHNHFATKGITTFKDQEIKRGHTIGPELVQAIRESRLSIVVLSKNYASSSWCLDELVEILKCRQDQGQMVMTIFYDVDPSDVRKQRGEFGNAFKKTCRGKTKEEKQRWIEALAYVATIAGEHSLNWEDEAKMIEKITAEVSNKLNVTPSKDFDGMVGMEAHLRNINSYLCLACDDVKMIGIQGPAGIGKTTIARALFNQLSADFKHKCFMGNLKGGYGGVGIYDHDSKLCLQSQLLSKVLNQKDMSVGHPGKIKEWLQDQKVLIVLDDVDDLEQLDALAEKPSWFGSGSRIVVTTKDRKILKAHWVNDIYHVGYPSEEEALEILCLSAFKKRSVQDGFEKVANKVAKLCGYLPLALHVVGSSLRGDDRSEWERQLSKLESSLDRKVEDVLKVGYDKLLKRDQSLFLHIAFFFNDRGVDHVTTMLADSNLDVVNGLKALADKSLVNVSTNGWITMHCLLQQLGRHIVHEQSDEPGKRQFLDEAEEIHDVLANKTGTDSVLGISFDTSEMSEFSISGRAFEGTRNLRFLKIYGRYISALQISEDMEYLPRLRLLHWHSYPRKSLPPTFQPGRLVELDMPSSNLETLWEGPQSLPNLKKIILRDSFRLKAIPDLSKATNLEELALDRCKSLEELPPSISNLHKLKWLKMSSCEELQIVPTNINLASLEEVDMSHCSRLKNSPDISMNIRKLNVLNTSIEEIHPSIVERLRRLDWLQIGNRNLMRLTHVPGSIRHLDLSNSDIERIPDCVIGLPKLISLFVRKCRKLVSVQGLPPSLKIIDASNCGSLERVCFDCNDHIMELIFQNCFKLDNEARRVILQARVDRFVFIPGKKFPAEFTHKGIGNSITISLGTFSASWRLRFRACLLLLPIEYKILDIACRVITEGGVIITELKWGSVHIFSDTAEHLFLCGGNLVQGRTASEILFEFSCRNNQTIIECGVQLMCEETESSEVDYFETGGNSNDNTNGDEDYETVGINDDCTYDEEDYEFEASQAFQCENVQSSKRICCWSWLRILCYGEEDEEYDDNEEESRTPIMTRRRRRR